MNIKVRTISQLPESESIGNNDVFQISKQSNGINYNSHKVKYGTIVNSVNSTILEKLTNDYNLKKPTINEILTTTSNHSVSINNINKKIDTINTNINQITTETPEWNINNKITNFISPNTNAKLVQSSDNTNKFYTFRFDSSSPRKYTDEQQINKTGNLFCYGWITAPKTIDPAEAWVGIETKNSNGQWVLTSLQPWIIGENSTVMQYIGFNCPVQQNTKIRITTGFLITDFSRSFAGRGLVVNVESSSFGQNITNTFIGYVLG